MDDETILCWHLVGLCCRRCPHCEINQEDAPIVVPYEPDEPTDEVYAPQTHDGE